MKINLSCPLLWYGDVTHIIALCWVNHWSTIINLQYMLIWQQVSMICSICSHQYIQCFLTAFPPAVYLYNLHQINTLSLIIRAGFVRDSRLGDIDDYDNAPVPKTQRDDLVNPAWMEARCLRHSPTYSLESSEVEFWNKLIDRYT